MAPGLAAAVYSAVGVVQQSGDTAGTVGDGDGEGRQGREVQEQLRQLRLATGRELICTCF